MSEHRDEPTKDRALHDRPPSSDVPPETPRAGGGAPSDPDVAAAYAPESDPVVTTAEGLDQGEAIQLYWEAVRAKARIGRLAVYMGTDLSAAVAPPAWSFGDSPKLADELLGHVLTGRKTATSTALVEFGEEALPRVGELSILLDGAGRPRALVRTTAVDTVRFDEVDDSFAAAEGEDDLSLASWREQHEIYWRRVLDQETVDPSTEIVLERFELLDPRVG